MAKELPYFRFTVSEWLNDNISLESYETKGVFSDVCAWYWFKDCSIDIAMLNKRFSDVKKTIKYLVELEIIKLNDNDSITIKFLDEQYDLLSEKRQKHIDSGRIGGLKRASNAQATLKQRSSYKDKDNNKDKDKELVMVKEIVLYLNKKSNKNFRPNTDKTKVIIQARLNEGFTIEDFKKVIDIKIQSWKNTDMAKFIRPETLFGTKFEGYLNEKPQRPERSTDTNFDEPL